MVVTVRESDDGSKQRAIQATERTAKAGAVTTQRELLKWLNKVVMIAKELCPIGTPASTGIRGYIGGTLARTIRIVTQAPTGGFFEVTKDPLSDKVGVTALITAGGWLINPNTGRICDYAQAVHDGTFKMAGRPFLTMAIEQSEPDYQMMVKKIGDAHENAWKGE